MLLTPLCTNELFLLVLYKNLGWSIVYNEKWCTAMQVIISKQNCIFLSLEIIFALVNSVEPDEMLHYVSFHLGLHSLQKHSSDL